MMRRRSTLQITLVLVGLVALSACGDDGKRSVYRTRQDCIDDWGEGKGCEEAPRGSTHYHTGYWYGPRWRGSGYHGTRSISSVSVSRGGFGKSGGFHSSFGG
jgi:uncharacterized protein YgiB involved in biofilm formation